MRVFECFVCSKNTEFYRSRAFIVHKQADRRVPLSKLGCGFRKLRWSGMQSKLIFLFLIIKGISFIFILSGSSISYELLEIPWGVKIVNGMLDVLLLYCYMINLDKPEHEKIVLYFCFFCLSHELKQYSVDKARCTRKTSQRQ